MNDGYLVDIIILKIEKKLKWRKVVFWTDNEYKKLSLLIYRETNISISPQTLKRLFGKVKYKDVYTPQPATKDALARFLDYKSWEDFMHEQGNGGWSFVSWLHKITVNKTGRRLAVLISITAVGLMILVFVPAATRSRNITFYAENITGTTPHTVSFHYDITKLRDREVYINFDHSEAEEKSPGELLDRNRSLINHCFESPGFFNVTVFSEGTMLGSAKIHALSDGWASYCFNDDNFSLRKFVFGLEKKVRDTLEDGLLYISPGELNKQGFNGSTVFYLEHMLYKDFKISADSCILEVRYKNSADMGGISCFDAEFRIIGEDGLASVMLVQKGCYRWSEVTVGEKHMNGKYDDLSSFSSDLSSWNILRIFTKNGKAVITNDSASIFTCDYNRSLGNVKGIRFVTKGSGAIDYVRLLNGEEQEIYSDYFDN